MEIEQFKANLEHLRDSLELPNPLELNSSLEVSLVVNRGTPLVVSIRYDIENQKVIVDAPLSYSIPDSAEALQDLMIKLFGDLIIRNKKVGRLVANPEENALNFAKSIKLERDNPRLLADFIPLFIEEALSWREKIKRTQKENLRGSCLQEEELLNFNFKIS